MTSSSSPTTVAAFTRTQRPAFFRLLDTLSPHPPFGVLVVTEQSRIGRDTFRMLHAIQQFQDAGLSQRQVAEEAKVAKNYITRLETGCRGKYGFYPM